VADADGCWRSSPTRPSWRTSSSTSGSRHVLRPWPRLVLLPRKRRPGSAHSTTGRLGATSRLPQARPGKSCPALGLSLQMR
jgi:hypothetical protein